MNIGTLVGAYVTRVFTDRICVTLPHKMKGYIPLTYISTQYTSLMHQLAEGQATGEAAHTLPELFRSGQFLTASVAAPPDDAMQPAKRLKVMGLSLSLYPSDVHGRSVSASVLRSGLVLQCSVTACEDHGYTVDTGVRGVSAAFLPEKDVPQDLLIAVGSVLLCIIVSVSGDQSALSLTLSAVPDSVKVAAKKATEDKYDYMLPGTVVSCVVSESTADGLAVHLGSEEDYYSSLCPEESELPALAASRRSVGIISSQHLRGPFDQCHLFRVGQKLLATVLTVTNMPRTVHLTLNKSLFNNYLSEEEDPQHDLAIKSVVSDATVISTSLLGVSLRLSTKCKGLCSLNKLPVTLKSSKLSKKYKAGLKVACKILHFNPFDQVFLVSMKTQDITEQQDILKLLEIGQVVPVKVDRYVDAGAVVKYRPQRKGGRSCGAVEGFVPRLHITDTNMTNPRLRHPVGRIVKARVLDVKKDDSTGKHKVVFTLKTLLVKSDFELIKEYCEDNIGKETEGVVSKVQPDKIFVQFVGNTFGILHANELSGACDFSEAYAVGTVLRVKIKGMGKQDPSVYFLSLLTQNSNPRKRKLDVDFDPAVERKKVVKKNRQESWLKSLKSAVTVSAQ
ncbi:S1 domain [Trinorchestia longiramus]|nr:S1 domain [Trinorchestia longiramus]